MTGANQRYRSRDGALVNPGSALSDVAVPLHDACVASKHCCAVRIELMSERAPVSVTLIKPAGIGSLFVEHAKNDLDFEPELPVPVHAADVIAKAILHTATHVERDIYVGSASRANSSSGRIAASLFDTAMQARHLVTRKKVAGSLTETGHFLLTTARH
jgi:short-subunit dehydrogenase